MQLCRDAFGVFLACEVLTENLGTHCAKKQSSTEMLCFVL